MIKLDAIRARAQRNLVLVTREGLRDVRLWEHSQRVTETAFKIAQLPGVPADNVDGVVLLVVGLYHDAGWVVQCSEDEISRESIGTKPTSPLQRDLGAVLMEENMKDLLPGETIARAADCLRSLSDHEVESLESRLVADAENLDEFGALSLWQMARKQAMEGKAMEAAIKTWETQKQYGYWSARINDSFRFEAVKQIAHERLVTFDEIIQQLKAHHNGDDLTAAAVRQPAPSTDSVTT